MLCPAWSLLEHPPPQPTLVVCLSSRSFTLEEFPGYLFSLVATFAVPSALLHSPIAAVSQQARPCSTGQGGSSSFPITRGSRAVLGTEAIRELAVP